MQLDESIREAFYRLGDDLVRDFNLNEVKLAKIVYRIFKDESKALEQFVHISVPDGYSPGARSPESNVTVIQEAWGYKMIENFMRQLFDEIIDHEKLRFPDGIKNTK